MIAANRFPFVIAALLFALSATAQTTVLDPTGAGGFEVLTGWSVDNDADNEWYSTGTYLCSGSAGAHIGRNSGNNNYLKNTSLVSHLWRDVTFPAGETDITLTFDYRGTGESSYDGMKVYLVPTSTTPVAGTALGSGQIGSTWYNQQASCTGASITIDGSNAGTTKRLVFSWINDASGGSNPAITLDNISIVSQVGGVTHNMGDGDLTICSADVFDSGGSGSNYSSSESYTETYCSDAGNCLTLTFTHFDTESGYDELNIYDGPNTSATLIGTYSGSSLPNGGTIGSSTGCLTLEWSSDGSFTDTGWEATISCNACPTCSDGIQNGSEAGVDCGGSCPTACPCEDISIGSLPYSSTGNNTSAYGDDYSSADACGSSYLNGDDVVYKYTPGSDDCIDITLTNTGTYVGLFVMDACPDDGGASCVASTTASGGNPSLSGVTLTGGQDYYIVISTWPAPQTTAYDISVTSSGLNPAYTDITCPGALGTGVVSVGALPYSSGAGTTCGAVDDITSSDIITCGSTSYSNDEDQVFIFTPATTGSVTVSLSTSDTYSALALYEGCPLSENCRPVAGTCITSSKSSGTSKSFTECLTGGVTYYLVLDSWNGSNCISYTDLTISAPTGAAPANDSPCTATVVSVGASCTFTTYDNACASNSGEADPGCANYVSRDLWFRTTVPASGNLVFDSDVSGITDGGMAIYSGTCGSLTLIECDDFDSDNGSMPRICRSSAGIGDCSGTACNGALTPGSDVFIRFWEDGGDNNGTFQLCVFEPVPPPAPTNDDPCNATLLSVGPSCLYSTYTNDCATASAGVPAPGCAGYSGGDVWFKAAVPASGSLLINTNTGDVSDGGMAIYTGTCGSLSLVECDDTDSENGSMPLIQNTALTPGDTIWIRVWEDGNNNNGEFDLCISDPCPGGAPANDDPCSAEALTLGIFTSGNNTCSNDINEPGAASCWTAGTRNTIWYSFVAPASGQVSIKAITGGLTDIQIALYSGTCGPSLTQVACNDNYSNCGTTVYGSEIVATGLTSGNTYYVAVDGADDETGTFSLIAIDGTASYPVVPGQDCSISQSIEACNEIMTVGNPGYSGTGTTCNFDGTNNCTGGEKNSVWYLITIAQTGSLDFSIVPNDFASGSCGPETDYDFLLWRIAGSGTTTDCAGILADPGTALEACNFSFYGVTGTSPGGTTPAAYGTCFDAAYEPSVSVTAGDQLLLCVQNYSGSSQGFTLNLTETTAGVIDYSTPTTLTWTGSTTTEWASSTNWGSCTEPDCGINALIIGGPANQPVISDSVFVQNLTINPGAVLTLQAGAVLRICGNLENYGAISADRGSVIIFDNGSTTQEITGNFTGTNKLGSVYINKTGGSVNIGADVEISGNLTMANSTSAFNTNGMYVKLGGDLINADGNNTFYNVGTTGTLEFNGTGPQQCTGTGTTLELYNMVMNNTGGNLTLNDQVNLAGALTLTQGNVITSTSALLNLKSTASSSSGSANSFVDGPMQKAGNTAFVFPVGDGTVWARLGISAPSGTGATSFRAEYFDSPYSNTSDLDGAALNNISVVEHWELQRINGSRSTEVTLYWEDGTRSGITDLTDLVVAHFSGGMWISETQAGGTTGISDQGTVASQAISTFSPITFGSNDGSENPLPVEFTSFSGKVVPHGNELHWQTASETNSDYFSVQASRDGRNYETIGRVDASGTTSETQAYTFLDRDAKEGETYYRLVQVDADASSSLSRTVLLERDPLKVTAQLYPNPVVRELSVEFEALAPASWTLSVTDLTGREVLSQAVQGAEGRNNLRMDLSALANGVYTLQLLDRERSAVFREQFTKQ